MGFNSGFKGLKLWRSVMMFYVRMTTVNEISNIDFEIVHSGDNLTAFLYAFAKLRNSDY